MTFENPVPRFAVESVRVLIRLPMSLSMMGDLFDTATQEFYILSNGLIQ